MEPSIYGYARVSTAQQHTDRQLSSLLAFGVAAEHIYTDRQSGKDFNRPAYTRLLKKLRRGDILAVTSIDRLGRNYTEILEQWRSITRERQADIVVLDMPLLDTRREESLTGMLISDIVLQLLSYVAHTERENLRKRQAEGVAEAKKRGVRFGRPRRPVPAKFADVCALLRAQKCTKKEAAALLGLPRSTFADMIRRFR